MTALHRNQLVWLSDTAWQNVRERAWDAQAQDLLGHWHATQLPLVVCRDRMPDTPHSVSLGLPAPLQWERRKLALEVTREDIARVGNFPLLRSIALSPTDATQVQALLLHTDALQVCVQVYGSYGWQQLTGLPCVRDSSDLDLLIAVPDPETAGQIAWLLKGLQLACRVDGELLFPNGQAVGWREYAQLMGGRVAQVLVKHRSGVHLAGLAQLQALPC